MKLGQLVQLSECIGTWTQNQLVRKQTVNYLAKLTEVT